MEDTERLQFFYALTEAKFASDTGDRVCALNHVNDFLRECIEEYASSGPNSRFFSAYTKMNIPEKVHSVVNIALKIYVADMDEVPTSGAIQSLILDFYLPFSPDEEHLVRLTSKFLSNDEK